jgi:hypothetical protein
MTLRFQTGRHRPLRKQGDTELGSSAGSVLEVQMVTQRQAVSKAGGTATAYFS